MITHCSQGAANGPSDCIQSSTPKLKRSFLNPPVHSAVKEVWASFLETSAICPFVYPSFQPKTEKVCASPGVC